MLRRLHPDQPDSFAFTEANQKWAEAQITKYPDGRQASAIIPLLWRAQEQEGWLSRPAMEHVAGMLGLAYIRALEVATFYFMFQLQPVGSTAHVQICGTTSCMICGAEDLIAVCKERIAPRAHQLSDDGKFSWEEVECLGACANAPMAQIGKDYYEDLTAESFAELLDAMARGEVPQPGSRIGRFASEPAGGVTSLHNDKVNDHNASVALALDLGDTLKRIDGTEVPFRAPWNPVMDSAARVPPPVNDDLMPPKGGNDGPTPGARPGAESPVTDKSLTKQETDADNAARPDEGGVSEGPDEKPMTDRMEGAGESTTPKGGAGREGSIHAGDGPSEHDTDARGSGDARRPPDRTEGPAGKVLSEEAAQDRASRGASGGAAAQDAASPDGDAPSRGGDVADTGGSRDPVNAAAADVPEGGEERPAGLDAPRADGADDLKRIKGVGPKLAESLHDMGIYHLDQIAAWRAEELAWVDRHLEGFKGRALRDDWVGQAKLLSREGQTKD
ncbi:NADH-quinone oxidoreductase subunit NuoE [Palleronia rufa]|uniref:NADH-quinone oxidoreductase subunit NuoE n=1 Tax=Palleronia rufa TaxID=1530186 RepID=UPI0005610D9B|nr:NADH-quinone oxidoreductase subunit NuoE [Palleronia rufa]